MRIDKEALRTDPSARTAAGNLAPLTNVVALTEEDSRAHAVVLGLGGRHWPAFSYTNPELAVRHLAAKGASMAVIGGTNLTWVLRALHACRQTGRFPIAILSASMEEDARMLLKEGATVVVHAHHPLEDVAARLLALGQGTAPTRGLDVRWLEADGLRLDLGARKCELHGERVNLSLNEFDLLQYLMSHPQEVVPSTKITVDLWNIPDPSGLNTLRLNVGRLRKKLGDSPREPTWIESVRGLGYQFTKPVAEVGQDRSEERLRHTVAALNAQQDGLYDLIDGLRSAVTVAEVAEVAVRWATDRNFADAATVFRFERRDGNRWSTLVTSAGMSSRWRQAISRGHPVDEGFIASAAYLRGDVIQLADMSRPSSRFPVTVSMSSAENLHACFISPLFRTDEIWGDLGFLSKETRAFPPARARFLRAAADLVSLALGAVVDPEAPDARVL